MMAAPLAILFAAKNLENPKREINYSTRNDGVAPLLAAIKGAKKRIDIAIFRADRKDVENALKAAAARGVKVTALIAHVNRGGGR